MNELELKYGCNPNQKPSRIFMEDGSELPIKVLNGRPGYINFLDAFNGWQLVSELKKATGLFKSELAKRMTIFKIPDLTFAKDESVEYGSKIDELLRGLNNKSEY